MDVGCVGERKLIAVPAVHARCTPPFPNDTTTLRRAGLLVRRALHHLRQGRHLHCWLAGADGSVIRTRGIVAASGLPPKADDYLPVDGKRSHGRCSRVERWACYAVLHEDG